MEHTDHKNLKQFDERQPQPVNGRALPSDDLKRLTDFFSILIQIDRRIDKKTYGKENK